MPLNVKESVIAGPVCAPAAIPVKTNIPAPTITPIPRDTIWNNDKLFFNLLMENIHFTLPSWA